MNNPVVNYDHKTIQMRRGSTTEWRKYGSICIPAEGEVCIEFYQDASGRRNGNTGLKVGNGHSSYDLLPYLITNQLQDDRISDEQIESWDQTVEYLENLVASQVGQVNPNLGDDVQVALDTLWERFENLSGALLDIEIGDIDGLEAALALKADQADLEAEIEARIDGDKALQDAIDGLEGYDDSQIIADLAAETAARIAGDAALAKDLADETADRIAGDKDLADDIKDVEAGLGAVSGQIVFGGSYDPSTGLIVKSNLSDFEEGKPLPAYDTVKNRFVICTTDGTNPFDLKEGDWLVAGESGWIPINYVSDPELPFGTEKQTLVHDGDTWVATGALRVDKDIYFAHWVDIKGAREYVDPNTGEGPPVLNEKGNQVTTLTSSGPIALQLGEQDAVLYDAWLRNMHTGGIKGTRADFWITNQSSYGIRISNGYLRPATSDYDIGSSNAPWGDGYFAGTVNASTLTSLYWTHDESKGVMLDAAVPALKPVGYATGELTIGQSSRKFKDGYFSGTVNAGSFVKSGGTSAQLLCADGSVVNKNSVGSDTDLSDYYTKTEADNAFKPKSYKAPVDSVNNKTGVVNLTASDVGAKPASYKAPVDSVNGKIGAVNLTASDVGASTYTGADAVKTSGNQEVAGIKTFTNDIRCKANVYAYYGSDERLKDDITPMPLGLIDGIEPATWKWKEDGQASAGVIAQQLQKAGLDDWVREAPNGDLGVDYNALIGMLIAEVKDLKRRLADG